VTFILRFLGLRTTVPANDHPIVFRRLDVLNRAHDAKLNNDLGLGKDEMIPDADEPQILARLSEIKFASE